MHARGLAASTFSLGSALGKLPCSRHSAAIILKMGSAFKALNTQVAHVMLNSWKLEMLLTAFSDRIVKIWTTRHNRFCTDEELAADTDLISQ
ncbi:hypothetical protein TRIUR3_08138 [Triticum urartu]|uniref:Uncharacterized protein n=2 Tax=Triticum urartu TaxID=4572 RepID=M8AMV3_TRIUA|nr:hypothetical protein TRIUR3_08138 [Triticum urartu]